MNSNIEGRRLLRYQQATALHQQATERSDDSFRSSSSMVDLSNRLLTTPPFIWDEFFKQGLDRNLFLDRSLEAFEFVGAWQSTVRKLDELVESCKPDIILPITVDLNGIVGTHLINKAVLKGLNSEERDVAQKVADDSTALVLPFLSSPETPVVFFRKDLVRGRFAFENLINGGARYYLPTILENVQVALTYTRASDMPVATINVSPILS